MMKNLTDLGGRTPFKSTPTVEVAGLEMLKKPPIVFELCSQESKKSVTL
jgi:hypothetical protein